MYPRDRGIEERQVRNVTSDGGCMFATYPLKKELPQGHQNPHQAERNNGGEEDRCPYDGVTVVL